MTSPWTQSEISRREFFEKCAETGAQTFVFGGIFLTTANLRLPQEGERAAAAGKEPDHAIYGFVVDTTTCIGCGSCVQACPEDDVLGLLHGQAVVLHGARCVGHGRCAQECPTGAIVVTLGDVSQRDDIPVVDERFESPRTRGLFLAGEVTGWSLVRTAVVQGTSVVDEVTRRIASEGRKARDGSPLKFEIDKMMENKLLITVAPDGYLKRTV